MNERAWDVRTPIHLESAFYDAAELKEPELEMVGCVEGLRLLHLQCHFGVDTLAWAAKGADVTGVDFSRRAIDAAEERQEASGLPARFVKADVQALPAFLSGRFDVAISTYGVVCWLDDLAGWAAGIRRALIPGGRLVLVEFHPILEVVAPGTVSGLGTYFGSVNPPPKATTGTYTDRHAPITYTEFRWQHPVSAVIAAVIDAGLTVTGCKEYPYSTYPISDSMILDGEDRWRLPGESGWPHMYSLTARCCASRTTE